MRIAELTARILLGSIFLTFGGNGFLNFLPSAPIDGLAGQFLQTLSESHYSLVISGFQVVGGSLLIANRFVGLALAMLAPIIVNILCFHVFMMPSGLALAIPVAGTGGSWPTATVTASPRSLPARVEHSDQRRIQ